MENLNACVGSCATNLEPVLKYLQGKKTIIIAIASLIITYSLGERFVSQNLAYLLNGILIILGGGASYLTGRLYDNQTVGKKNPDSAE